MNAPFRSTDRRRPLQAAIAADRRRAPGTTFAAGRRRTLQAGVAAAAAALARGPHAQTAQFPSRPIRLVVPYAAGGIADLLGRVIAKKLSETYRQPVVVENRPGAGGHVGGEVVARSTPDGHTLVLATIAHNGAAAMYKGLSYDPAQDLPPVVLVAESAGVLVVNPALPCTTVREFIALAKARPGQLNYGSAGNGSAIHMATELFKFMTGTDLRHVAYRGSAPAMTDLIGGQIQLMFENIATALAYVETGKVRALGVTGRTRSARLPAIPTIAEAGVPGYAAEPWYTVSAPRGVPAEIVRRLNADLDAALRSPDVIQSFDGLGVTALGGTPDDAARRNALETERWTRVIQAARIQPD